MKKLLVLFLILSNAAVFSAADSDLLENGIDAKNFEHHLELYNQAVANRDFAGIFTNHAALRQTDKQRAFAESVNNEALLKLISDTKPSEYQVIAQILNLFPPRSPISKAIREQNWPDLRAVIDRLEQQHTTQNNEPVAAPSSVPTQISAAPIATTPIQVTTAPVDMTALNKIPSPARETAELPFFGGKHIPSLKGMLISEVLKNDLLKEVPDSYFASQESLTKLFIDYMKINDLNDVLPDIARAYFLYAKGNLSALPAWLQPHFESISVQDLIDNNMLPKIGSDNTLDLNNRYINDLTGLQRIPGIGNIKNLILSDNNLTTIAPGAFTGLDQLKSLNLYNNNLTTLASDTFAGLNNLAHLGLNKNEITVIDPNAFVGLDQLENIHLHNNKITTIAPDTFAGLERLRQINLNSNNISVEDQARIQAEVGNNVAIQW